MKKTLLSVVLLLVSFSSFGEVESSNPEIKLNEIETSVLKDDQFEKEYTKSFPESDSFELSEDQGDNEKFDIYSEIKTLVSK